MQVYDTTLRDGAQREGISYSVVDKLAVARLLDEFGVGFIEGGWPGAMPKDTEFFRRARTELDLKHALLVAFGATRKAGARGRGRPAGAGAARRARRRWSCLVAKSDLRHVERALRTTAGGEPGDGPRHGRATWSPRAAGSSSTASTSSTATRSTPTTPPRSPRPRSPPAPRRRAVRHQRRHAAVADHRPCESRRLRALGRRPAVAGSASTARTTRPARWPTRSPPSRRASRHFQCTANGYGERPGNADLFAVVGQPPTQARAAGPTGRVPGADGARLARHRRDRQHRPRHPPGLRRGRRRSPTRRACTRARSRWIRCSTTTSTRRSSATTCGSWSPRWPAGPASSSRAASSVSTWPAIRRRWPGSPTGSRTWRRGAGRSRPPTRPSSCWSARSWGAASPAPFRLESYRVLVEHREDGAVVSEATVKLRVSGERVIATAEGNGPVNALDEALRGGADQALPGAGRVRAGRLQGPHPGGLPRHRRGHPGAGGDPDGAARTGPRSACTRTWSRRAGSLVDALSYGLSRQVRV